MLPEATLAVIISRMARSLTLSHWPAAIFSACKSGVPEFTSVESWWKNASVSSSLADLCGRFATRACATTHSSNGKRHLPRSSLRVRFYPAGATAQYLRPSRFPFQP